jgi:hypothetical protein
MNSQKHSSSLGAALSLFEMPLAPARFEGFDTVANATRKGEDPVALLTSPGNASAPSYLSREGFGPVKVTTVLNLNFMSQES